MEHYLVMYDMKGKMVLLKKLNSQTMDDAKLAFLHLMSTNKYYRKKWVKSSDFKIVCDGQLDFDLDIQLPELEKYASAEKQKFEWLVFMNACFSKNLSKRETEVFYCKCMGYQEHEIANKLNTSSTTVNNQLSVVYRKLDARGSHQAFRLIWYSA